MEPKSSIDSKRLNDIISQEATCKMRIEEDINKNEREKEKDKKVENKKINQNKK